MEPLSIGILAFVLGGWWGIDYGEAKSTETLYQYQRVIDGMNEQRALDEHNKQIAFTNALLIQEDQKKELKLKIADEIGKAKMERTRYEALDCINQPIHPDFNEWMRRWSEGRGVEAGMHVP